MVWAIIEGCTVARQAQLLSAVLNVARLEAERKCETETERGCEREPDRRACRASSDVD